MREEQDDHGSRDEGSRKRRLGAFLFLRLALRAKCRVYHVYHALIWLIKLLFPVMQAKVVVTWVFFFGERGKKTRPFNLASQTKGEEGPPDRNLVFRKTRGQKRRTGREKESSFVSCPLPDRFHVWSLFWFCAPHYKVKTGLVKHGLDWELHRLIKHGLI